MKFSTKKDLKDFLKVVDKCKSDVLLVSNNGDTFNLKSLFSRYIAIGELLKEHGTELELFCRDKQEEQYFLDYFDTHTETL